MELTNRSYQSELLDGEDIPFEDIKKNMEELETINTLLGGHSITLKGFRKLLGERRSITICEIGCGGGDNLAAIVKWCRKNDVAVYFIGIDIKKACIDVAKSHPVLQQYATWHVSDYRAITFDCKPDIIFSSLFCHHFTNEALIMQLQWLKRNSGIGFFINDLHRHWLAYSSIRMLTSLFSSSNLVKNDAPLSVARGFLKKEWTHICALSEIGPVSIEWKWAFRYLILYRHG